MPRTFIILIIVCFSLFCACEKERSKYSDCTDEDYENCIIDKPFYGKTNVRIRTNSENPKVKVVFFEGNYEAADTVHVDTLSYNRATFYFELDKHYSAAAYYKSADNKIIVVDGGFLERYTYVMCEYTCYGIIELDLDLRLK